MTRRGEKILIGYCIFTSVALAAVLTMGAARAPTGQFDQITVHRINVVEPDGTLRMVIADKARLPGVIVKGQEQPPSDRPQAGLLFYNDEGTENGGLIFGGRKDPSGKVVDAGGSLSFDRYGASETISLAGVDDATDQFAGLKVFDTRRRIWVGRTADGVAAVNLMDPQGRKRLALQVAPSGEPSLQFFDADGRVVKTVVGGP